MGAGADALKAAIDHAWRVFDLPAPDTTGVCENCCMDAAIEANFLKTGARDLPSAYVRDWYFAAYADGISHDHIAWFLPRVMEMLANGEEVAVVGHEVVFGRLPLTGFPDQWRTDEVEAVNRFALAFFEAMLVEPSPAFMQDLDSWLCMIGQGGIDIEPVLRRMDALPDDDLAGLLHHDWFIRGHGSIHFDAFWDTEPARTLVWNWYTSADLLARLERAAMAGNEKALDVHSLVVTYAAIPSPP